MINLGYNKTNDQQIHLNPDHLTTHTAIFGMTGSGKTGAVIGIAEGLIRKGVPLLLIDIKGDLINLAVQSKDLGDKMLIRYLTPGATHGDPVNIFTGLNNPDQISSVVSALLEMVGMNGDPLKSCEHSFLSSLLTHFHENKEYVSLNSLIPAVLEPPFDSHGSLPLDQAISKRQRSKLATQLNNVLASPVFAGWRTGITLDFDDLFHTADDRVPVVVYSVAHLYTEAERLFAITYLLNAYKQWLLSQPGTETLRSCMIIDECAGLLPPHPRVPPTKPDIMVLLKQGRAFGGGMILATQNPKDVDYKALSNCSTWIVGRLQTHNDRERVIEGMCTTGSYGKHQLSQIIKQLNKRQFLMTRADKMHVYRSADVETILSGPMTCSEVEGLKNQGLLCAVYNLATLYSQAVRAKAAYLNNKTEYNLQAWLGIVDEYKRREDVS